MPGPAPGFQLVFAVPGDQRQLARPEWLHPALVCDPTIVVEQRKRRCDFFPALVKSDRLRQSWEHRVVLKRQTKVGSRAETQSALICR